jgi:hypothetical protein
VDPFAVAAEAAAFNAQALPGVMDFAADTGFGLAREATSANVTNFIGAIDRLMPGYGKLLRGMETQAMNFMEGRLPQATKDLLYRESAERGVARGVFGQRAQYEGLTSIRDKQLEVMELGFNQASSLRQQADALASSLLVRPEAMTMEIFARSLPLFTLSVDSAIETELSNSQGMLSAGTSQAQIGLGYAELAFQQEEFAWRKAEAERQRKAARRGGLLGALGTIGGAALGSLIPGVGTAIGMSIGASLGGAAGSMAGGNYGAATQGIGRALGTYAGYEANQQFLAALRPASSGPVDTSFRFSSPSLSLQSYEPRPLSRGVSSPSLSLQPSVYQ